MHDLRFDFGREGHERLVPLECTELHYAPISAMIGTFRWARAGQAVLVEKSSRSRFYCKLDLADERWGLRIAVDPKAAFVAI